LESCRLFGSFLRSFVPATSAPGPTTDSTRGSRAICVWKRSSETSSERLVIGRLSLATTMLYGVAQPGPMVAVTASKSFRACDDLGSCVTSGGPVSRPSAGTASASSAPTPMAAIGAGSRVTQAPPATRRRQARATGRGAGKLANSRRRPRIVSTAGMTTVAAPMLSMLHNRTPTPSEPRMTVGEISTARIKHSTSAVPPQSTARPAVPTARAAARPDGTGSAPRARSSRKRSTIMRAKPTPSARPATVPTPTAVGSVSMARARRVIAPMPVTTVVPGRAACPAAALRSSPTSGRRRSTPSWSRAR
jgi:hypothetical protein